MKTIKNLLTLIVILIALALIASCSEDCPTGPVQPKPYKGWLYAADNYLYRIDIETDSLVDSFSCDLTEGMDAGYMAASPDGDYLAVSFTDHLEELSVLRIYDARSMTPIVDLPRQTPLLFLEKEDVLITSGGTSKTVIHYLSPPDFSRVDQDSLFNNIDSIKCGIQKIDENNRLFYLWMTSRFSDGRDSLWLASYDYKTRKIIQEWPLELDIQGAETFQFNTVKLYNDPFRMYFLGYSEYGNGIFGCHDFESGSTLFTFQLFTHYGNFDLTPDNLELYVTDPGAFFNPIAGGTLYVLDAITGAYLHGISLYGYDTIPERPLNANNVIFTPKGGKAYVACGRMEKGSGTICVVDTKTRNIIKLIWPELGHYPVIMTIGPK